MKPSWSSLRRRWPEALLGLVALLAFAVLDGAWQSAFAVLLAGLVIFAIRRRVGDVARAAGLLAVLLLVAAVLTITVDVGPVLRGYLEHSITRSILRPTSIGRLALHLASGSIVLEDVRIDPPKADVEPFFTAKEVRLGVAWWTVFTTRDLRVDSIALSDWTLVIERWPKEGTPIPRLGGAPSTKKKGKPLFTTTIEHVSARRGRFTYHDHGSWKTILPNLNIEVGNETGEYLGRASASNGVWRIWPYEPMRADIRVDFRVDGPIISMTHIHLHTDGSSSTLTGIVDVNRWPEMTYQVVSNLDLATMRAIWFKNEAWRMHGAAQFAGSYHLFKGGFELKGAFQSDRMRWEIYDFENLNGFVRWRPDRLDVTGAQTRAYDGMARFLFTMAPLGKKTPALAHFDAYYENVDLSKFAIGTGMTGIRPVGFASGHNLLEWPSGHYSEHRGHGEMTIAPPPGVDLLTRDVQPREEAIHREPVKAGPEANLALFPVRTPVGGEFNYRFGPEWFEVLPSRLATPRTYLEFEGTTAYGERSQLPIYARSADWQESDRVLAGVMTAFGSATNVVKIGGWGEFRGTLTKSLGNPLVVGEFSGDGLRSWDVVWGRGTAQVAVENGYADVTNGLVRSGDSVIRANGRFSLGYPRKDGGEEINARIAITDRDLKDLRHAFVLDEWPVNGKLSGDYHLYGTYNGPFGFGGFNVRDGDAWKEPFTSASASLRFEGTGVRVDGFTMNKGGGSITGAAWIEWEGRYSFNGNGRGIPMESVQMATWPEMPVSGILQFTANGTGTFLHPRYDARFRIDDLFVKDEGVGQVTGDVGMRDTLVEARFEVASPRLLMSGKAQVELTDVYDSEITLRFTDTSLDPYLRLFQPGMSPFARAVGSGSVHVVGQLYNPDQLLVETKIDQLDLRLFDYDLATEPDHPIRVAFDRNVMRLQDVRLRGRDTALQLTGAADIANDRMDVDVKGDANLGILQAFFRDIRSSGRATLAASIRGPVAKPEMSGSATITGGRIRSAAFPHSIRDINGTVTFGANAIRMQDITAQIGNGQVNFGGRIEMNGYVPNQLALTATGERMEFRYPEGFRWLVDADLALVGPLTLPTLRGTLTVRSGVYRRQLTGSSFLDLAGGLAAAKPSGGSSAGSLPVKLDVRVSAPPGALRVDTNVFDIMSSADLSLRGDVNNPQVFGRVEVDRGEAILEGKRYVVTHGTLDFTNPTKIEPFFDIETETRVRAPGQTYQVTLRFVGTPSKFEPQWSSDPPLPSIEVASLLLGDARTAPEAELGTFRRTERQASLASQQVQQALTGIVSGNVTRAVEQVFGLDTFQITPSLFDPYQRNMSAGARVTVGKRISDKIYLTYSYSRNITAGGEQVVLIEYDQSDRFSWIVSRNEDATYAVDVRVRHVF